MLANLMPLRWAALSVLCLLGGPPAAVAGSEVEIRGGKVSIHVQDAPLAGILDQISQQSGARVLYLGKPPNPAVTVAIQEKPLAEALAELFGRVGLDYAVQLGTAAEQALTIVVVERKTSAANEAAPAASFEDTLEPGEPIPPGQLPSEETAVPRSAEEAPTAGMQLPPSGISAGPAGAGAGVTAPDATGPGVDPSAVPSQPPPGESDSGELPAGMHMNGPPAEGTGPQARVGSSGSVPGMHFNVPPPDSPGPQPSPTTPTPQAPPEPPRP